MQITIASVGKLKEKYWNDALAEFQKRLSAYTKLNFVTILEEKMPENPSDATREKILVKETERLIQIIPKIPILFYWICRGRKFLPLLWLLKFNS